MKFFIFLLLLCFVLTGCTIHFKGKDIELESEPTLSHNNTFELEKIDLFVKSD